MARVTADAAPHLRANTGRDIVLAPSLTTEGPCLYL